MVPADYWVKVPNLVWESKQITWHGAAIENVLKSFTEALIETNLTLCLDLTVELIASGYFHQFWDVIWECFFVLGLGIVDPSLYGYFKKEYELTNSIYNKFKKSADLRLLPNHQVIRNHLIELIAIFAVLQHQPISIEDFDIEEAVSEPIRDNHSRSVAQEYILLTKTDDVSEIEAEELYFNLSKFLEAVNEKPIVPDKIYFWIKEIVKMDHIKLRSDFQCYLPRTQAEWVTSPANILWNYIFIRAPNQLWTVLADLMEIFTLNYKRHKYNTCGALLYNGLLLLSTSTGHKVKNIESAYKRSSNAVVIQTVMKANLYFLGLEK